MTSETRICAFPTDLTGIPEEPTICYNSARCPHQIKIRR